MQAKRVSDNCGLTAIQMLEMVPRSQKAFARPPSEIAPSKFASRVTLALSALGSRRPASSRDLSSD